MRLWQDLTLFFVKDRVVKCLFFIKFLRYSHNPRKEEYYRERQSLKEEKKKEKKMNQWYVFFFLSLTVNRYIPVI